MNKTRRRRLKRAARTRATQVYIKNLLRSVWDWHKRDGAAKGLPCSVVELMGISLGPRP